ncbi:MAG: oligosaccharide flippase family protein [Nanoarchaeota archaeon]
MSIPKKSFKSQAIENSIWNLVSSMINRIGGLIFVIILLRTLKPEGFGTYTLAMTITLFFVMISDMGVNQTLIRYISHEINLNKLKAAAQFRYLFKIKIILTSILSLSLLILAYPLSFYIFKNPAIFILLSILSFYVFFISIAGFLESLFFIRKEVKYISLKEVLFQSARILSALIVAYFIVAEFKLVGLMILFVLTSILIFFFVFVFSRKLFPFLFLKTKEVINQKKISRFIFFLNIQNIAIIILMQASIFFLGIFSDSKHIGFYNSAFVLVSSLSSLMAFTPILLPILTQFKRDRFNEAVKKIFRILMIVAIPMSFGLFVLAKYFIVLIPGYDYLPATNALKILAFMLIPTVGTSLFLTSFSAKNKPKEFAKVLSLSAVILVVLNYVFIKIFSTFSSDLVFIGVSIANLISWFLCFFLSAALLRKEFKINIFSAWLLKPIFSSMIMSGFMLLFLSLLKDINIINGLLLVIAGIIVYFVSLILMKGLHTEELEFFKKINFFRKIRNSAR